MRALILFGLLLFAGCTQVVLPEEVPEDFQIVYATGAMHAEWGMYGAEIDAQGNGQFEKSAAGKSVTEQFQLSDEELLGLYQEVVKNGFFKLNVEYRDPAVMDGGYSSLSVTANGEKHTVSVTNTQQESFSRIEERIDQILRQKLGNWRELPG